MMPTLNQKRRYIVFRISERVSGREMINAVEESVTKFSGLYGLAKAGCKLVHFDGNWGVLRVGVKEVDAVRASMLFIEEVGGKKVNISFPYVGGTIRSALNVIIKKGGDKNAINTG